MPVGLSSTFVETVAILVITAVLTGLLVPIIKGQMDARKAHQTKIIDAQAQLLDDVTENLWAFRSLVSQVAYYREMGDVDRFLDAFNAYDSKGWEVFARFRTRVSIGRRLTSATVQADLLRLYEHTLTTIDKELNDLVERDRQSLRLEKGLHREIDERWRSLHTRIRFQLTDEIEVILIRLAIELRLIRRPRRTPSMPEATPPKEEPDTSVGTRDEVPPIRPTLGGTDGPTGAAT